MCGIFNYNNTKQVRLENDNANISSQFGKGVRIALVEPTFTAAAYNDSFYVFYQKYSHVPAKANITGCNITGFNSREDISRGTTRTYKASIQ